MSFAKPKSEMLKTPEWLEKLENRRKRHKLAHEIGAGAPCFICKESCKGLNLHFWRKICIECKCRKEDHEVLEDDDYAQFEILFGAKKVKKTTLKFNAQEKSFDWVPPNVSPELAVDYLRSLPESKIPISNTDGARYRKQQLEKQVPLHDIDPNVCHDLSSKEAQEFQKYLENLKNNVIGQGKIIKYQAGKMLKENYICNSLQSMWASSNESNNLKPQGAEVLSYLAVEKLPVYNVTSQMQNVKSYPFPISLAISPHQNNQSVNSLKGVSTGPLKTYPIEKNENENSNLKNWTVKSNVNIKGPKPYLANHVVQKGKINTSEELNIQSNNLTLKTPSSYIGKNYSCINEQNNNDSISSQDHNLNENPNESLIVDLSHNSPLFSENAAEKKSNFKFRQELHDGSILKDSLSEFKDLNISSHEVPFAPVQESRNIKTPKLNVSDSLNVAEQIHPLEDESNTFPSPPDTCQHCLGILNSDEVVVQTERAGSSALWHAKCFVCGTCQELLVDLMYFFHKGTVYCGRHYADIMKIPRCYACDELIFVKEYTCAEGESYHVRHFCCFLCDEPLAGKQYILKDNQPSCLACYQSKYGKKCRTCAQIIAAGEQRVSWKNLDFHVSPKCFRCTQCSQSLLEAKFVVKNELIFCKKECVQEFFKAADN